jgi:transcriptional regulator with XRE-family HTH domain
MVNQAFARTLVRLRERKGISQEALALEIGFHRTYISQLERSINSPTLRTIQKISDFFDLNLVEFMTLVQEELDLIETPSSPRPQR